MPDILDARVLLALRSFGWFASLFAVALGCTVLAGWLTADLALVTIRPGLAAMAPVTAFSFILAGTSLGARKLGRRRLAGAAAILLLLLAASVMASHVVIGRDAINPLIGNRLAWPGGAVQGHTGPATALAFLLLGIGFVGMGNPARAAGGLVSACAAVGSLLSGVALLGYAYGVEGLYATAFYRSTALHTAMGLFVLFLASLVQDPKRGAAAVVASARPSGAVTRMQLLLTVLLPSLVGLLLLRAMRAGYLAPSLVVALLVVSTTIPMVLRILVDGGSLDRLDMQLRKAIGNEQALNNELEMRVAARTAELQAAEGALRQAQKMEAVGQLTGGIAHDFNNLLTGILGSLELMRTRIAQGRIGDLDTYLATAQSAAKRAAALTHRLLAFSRQQTLDPRPADINRLVAGMEALVRQTTGPAIAVEIVGAAGLWTALVDTGQVENTLLNLVINARDAMPDGGKLVIETANRPFDERAAQERDLPAGQYISLCVSDNGSGMPPDVIARAFDPFFTTKPIGQGTGLGLSMVYGFARQSGGQARIYSEPGKGTMVCLYLPRHAGDASAGEIVETETSLAGPSISGETVLVVDDEPSVVMLVADLLDELGYATLDAQDGPSALAILRSDRRIDLMVSDIGLPGGLDGRQLADAARRLRPRLKVLFITGFAENAIFGHGHLENGMQVLTKPFAMEDLARRVGALMTETS